MRPRHLKRAAENALRRWLISSLVAGVALAYPACAQDLGWNGLGQQVRVAGRVVIIGDPQQNDINIQWLALNPGNGGYAAALANLASAAYTGYTVADGGNGYTGLKIVGPVYASEAQLSSWGLATIDGTLVIDRLNYSKAVNPNYTTGVRTPRTNEWGDSYYLYSKFLKAPQTIPTTGYDRLLAHWKGSSETAIYIGQSNTGDGTGSNYANQRRVKDFLGTNAGSEATVDPTGYDIIVLCGTLSRFQNEGNGPGLFAPTGTSGTHALILSHPVNPALLMGGATIGGATGEDADWTDDGGGRWHCDIPLNSNYSSFFALSNAGGTLRPLTHVADAATCSATSDSTAEATVGGKTRLYARLSDGSNPRTTTFFGGSLNGVFIRHATAQYFDIYGVKLYQGGWRGSFHQGSDFRLYGVQFLYGGVARVMAAAGGTGDEGTGAITTASYSPSNRVIMGCVFSHWFAGIYDENTNGFSDGPTNTLIRDSYFEYIGALRYGIDMGSGDDTHAVATMSGVVGHYLRNNAFRYCAHVTIFHYSVNQNFVTPTGGLENEPLYTDAYPPPWYDPGDGSSTYDAPFSDIEISDNFIRDPLTQSDNPSLGSAGRGIQLGGDGDAGYKVTNVRVVRNRVEGDFSEGSILTKWKPIATNANDATVIQITDNVIRGATIGFQAFGTTTVSSVVYETSFTFDRNDVDATIYCKINNSLNPDRHARLLRNNRYVSGTGRKWIGQGGAEYTTIADWRSAAPADDDYDTTSSVV